MSERARKLDILADAAQTARIRAAYYPAPIGWTAEARSLWRLYYRIARAAWCRAEAQRAARPADVWPVYGRLSTSTDVLSTSERSAS